MKGKRWNTLGCIVTLLVMIVLPLAFFLSTETIRIRHGHGPETRVKGELQNIVIALKGYQTEYNRLPLELFPMDESKASEVRGQLLVCLMGKKQHPANPRDISFLEAKPARNGKGGIDIREGGMPVFVDPWGHPYLVVIDKNGDGEIPNPARGQRIGKGRDVVEPDFLPLEVTAFSAGPDGNPDTWEDNIVSWR